MGRSNRPNPSRSPKKSGEGSTQPAPNPRPHPRHVQLHVDDPGPQIGYVAQQLNQALSPGFPGGPGVPPSETDPDPKLR